MSVQFQCPACKTEISFSYGDPYFQNCPFCKAKIIIPSEAIHRGELLKQDRFNQTQPQLKNIASSSNRQTPPLDFSKISDLANNLVRTNSTTNGGSAKKSKPLSVVIQLVIFIAIISWLFGRC
ncbi:MAG: hypothetical protein ACK5NT_03455 [Pyrinomonadaceae bacterium]